MDPDALFNVVYRAKQRGCEPRRIGEEVWEARCPVCRRRDHTLVLERRSLVTCRGPKRCPDHRILEMLRLPGRAAYKPTPPEVICELRRMPIQKPVVDRGRGSQQMSAVDAQPASSAALGTRSPGRQQKPDMEPCDRSRPTFSPAAPHGGDSLTTTNAGAAGPAPRFHANISDAQTAVNAGAAGPGLRSYDTMTQTPSGIAALREQSPDTFSVSALVDRLSPRVVAPPLRAIEDAVRTAALVDRVSDPRSTPIPLGVQPAAPAVPPPPVQDHPMAPTPAEVLARLAAPARMIRAADGRHYAAIPIGERVECHPIESDEFRRLLLRLYHDATGDVPPQAVLANVVRALRGRAELTEHAERVFVRVARDETAGAYLFDLGGRSSRAVRVGATGWEVIDRPPVPFWRPRGQSACPPPAQGGSIELLRKFANVADAQWPLLVVWLTAALRPVGPYPLLVVTGEQGSAKSTLAQVCRWLIDPHATPLRSLPRSERDLMVAAHNNWLLAFDNVSSLTHWQSDAFCRLSTGAGFATRALFADDRELLISAQRPMILNGIDDFVRRSDLIDRCIFLHLAAISSGRRRSDEAFWAEFHADHPRLLGALLDAASGGIRFAPEVELATLSRMADLDRWGEGVARGLGWPAHTFVNAYRANRKSACAQALEDNPVVTALTRVMAAGTEIQSTATDLLASLNLVKPDTPATRKEWPRSPRELSVILRRLSPQFREIGFEIAFGHDGSARLITVRVA